MNEMSLSLPAVQASLPDVWPQDLLPGIQRRVENGRKKIVVLDDDPTGTQTVYDIPVLTEWSVPSLTSELANGQYLAFYILTNSRSLPEAEAKALNAEIGHNLVAAAKESGQQFVLVSRSDSTLRGHYPGEVDALIAATNLDVDATLIIPFFLEGGRYTVGDVHYVAEGDELIPASATPFAQDKAFGYHHANLREWVAEKSNGRFAAESVRSITLAEIRTGGPKAVTSKLLSVAKGGVCVVNAMNYQDTAVFVAGLLDAEKRGKTYLYRTAASFVRVRCGLPERPLLTADELFTQQNSDSKGGLVVVGSYVPKTTAQINYLLQGGKVTAVEIQVGKLLDDASQKAEVVAVIAQADQGLQNGEDVVIYTSRQLVSGDNAVSSLAIGNRVSESLIEIVRGIKTRPRYLIAKGGITSSDVATKALNIQRAMVLGQLLPGIPVWQAGAESRYPDIPYIVFPGNVGGDDALRVAVEKLAKK